MDYTTASLAFRLKKALRYVRLYGVRRTLAKVRGQYHMHARFDPLPAVADPPPAGGHVGLIGCGNYAFSNIAYYLKKNYGHVMRAAMDIDPHKAASLYRTYGLRYYTDDAERLFADPQLDLLYIASNHASHAEYAIRGLETGRSVHIEKPHVVSTDQLVRLCRAMSESRGRVGLGFNRPGSRLGRALLQHLASESGPSMFNWFLAGHELPPDHWYFRAEEGGRVLGNLCHWTDFLYCMVPPEARYPITIHPTRAEASDCDIAVTYVFGDGSIAAITFSAKGHTFEGVRETFAAHRGNALMALHDFKTLTVEIVDRRIRYRNRFRDHGHEARIRASYEMSRPDAPPAAGATVAYVWETAELFLETREALERNEIRMVQAFDPHRLETRRGVEPGLAPQRS